MIFLFHSIDFIIFFLLIFLLYWTLSKKLKNSLLLIASYIFYASWSWKLLGLLLFSSFKEYFFGLLIYSAKKSSIKKILLATSVATNLAILGFFKYYNFFVENLLILLNLAGFKTNLTTLNIILPIGISFYTFQIMSYSIDMYRGKISPTRNIIDFLLFVSYFPQLIAGPIERAKNLLPKIQMEKKFKNVNFKEGVYLFIYGMFTKVVLADYAGTIVDKIYFLSEPSGGQILLATYAFAIQIYCDFLGYSNMAKGISMLLGIGLTTNFNLPYFAKNPSEFWRRWHISLSTWVRDYIYIPLGGSKTKFFGVFSLFITMFLMGLWHGAAWNFVLWGIYWFLIIMAYRLLKIFMRNIQSGILSSKNFFLKLVSMLFMFHLIVYSWLIFRSRSFVQIVAYTKSIISGINFADLFNVSYIYFYAIVIFLLVYEAMQYFRNDQLLIIKKNFYYQMIFYLIIFFMYVEIGAVSDAKFLYFQF